MSCQTKNHPIDIPCVILASGQSRRFGSNKAFAPINGERMIDIIIRRMESQTVGPIAISAPAGAGFDDLRHPVLSDQLPGKLGPLAGLHAAMIWARQEGYHAVITTPVDTPMLPRSFVEHLVASGAPSIAKCGGRVHPVHGLWPISLIEQLADAISGGVRPARAWAAQCQAVECVFHEQFGLDPFFNINTSSDLEIATRLMHGS